MPWHRGHGVQHSGVLNVASRGSELLLHHCFALCEKFGVRCGLRVAGGQAQANQQWYDQCPVHKNYQGSRSLSLTVFPEELKLIGTRTTMLVPRPAAVRTSNCAPRFSARARILESPKPSPLANFALAMPDPLSVTSRTRFGGSHRTLTLMTVGLAWRTALLIAS